jgi:hypothetical protein
MEGIRFAYGRVEILNETLFRINEDVVPLEIRRSRWEDSIKMNLKRKILLGRGLDSSGSG